MKVRQCALSSFLGVLIVLVFSLSHAAVAQNNDCVRYRFNAGDSVVYRSEVIDTIDFRDQEILIREREEVISLVCDYVNDKSEMFLRQTLESFISKERHIKDTNRTVRTYSPWLGRSAYIILDSTGRRVIARQLDTLRASLSPGGAFQPTLLLSFLDTTCQHSARGTWMIERLDTLAENGFPYPLMRHLFSCSVRDTILDSVACFRVLYAETGQGSMTNVTRDASVYMRSVANGHGLYIFSKKELQPLKAEAHVKLNAVAFTPEGEHKGEIKTHSIFRRIYPPAKKP